MLVKFVVPKNYVDGYFKIHKFLDFIIEKINSHSTEDEKYHNDWEIQKTKEKHGNFFVFVKVSNNLTSSDDITEVFDCEILDCGCPIGIGCLCSTPSLEVEIEGEKRA